MFERIKQFHDLQTSQEFAGEATVLNEELLAANDTRLAFNEREILFNREQTAYPDLAELIRDFKPFFELTQMAWAVKCGLSDWNNEALVKQDPNHIEQSVTGWLESCERIKEEFKVKYPAAAGAAEAIYG